ncbi:hypothetical protein NC652_013671 [Populus alba x Populus x berolinensis]|nr:hypothetical protein NC652_013671 [Populus alba x Populus x berolinensis]
MVVMAYSSLYHNDTWHRILNVEIVVIKMKLIESVPHNGCLIWMLRIASSHSCIIVLQKGQRLGFPYSFKSQLCAPGNFCFCTISRVGRVLQARGGFPSPWPENVSQRSFDPR